MKTTELFAELLVIGVGALGWVLLLLFWLAPDLKDALSLSPVALIPGLALMFLLGIVTDRAADSIFERSFAPDRRGETDKDRQHWKNSCERFMAESEVFATNFRYGHSRLRPSIRCSWRYQRRCF